MVASTQPSEANPRKIYGWCRAVLHGVAELGALSTPNGKVRLVSVRVGTERQAALVERERELISERS